MLCEVSAVGKKIFLSVMTLVKSEKYIKEFCKVLDEVDLKYELNGPFPKNLPCQEFER